MEATSIQKYVRVSPKKIVRLTKAVKGRRVKDALAILRVLPGRNTLYLSRAINSAYSNLKVLKEGDIDEDSVYIKSLEVGRGPVMKRIKPRAQGRADIIRRPLSHIKVVVTEY
jgi:large subunit ribosomal protein L22